MALANRIDDIEGYAERAGHLVGGAQQLGAAFDERRGEQYGLAIHGGPIGARSK
jgi:hypothetical protein